MTRNSRNIDLTYFNEINSFHSAYYIGFIVGDGCLYKDKLIINIGVRDREIIDNFINYYKGTPKISIQKQKENRQDNIRLVIASNLIINQLNKIGIPYKQNKECFGIPIGVNKEFYADFIRGYFDADGCISIQKSKKWNTYYYEVSFSDSNKQVLEDIQKYFKKEHDLEFVLRDRKTYYSLRTLGKKKCMKFFNIIYNNPLFLKRKFNKFIDSIPC